MSIYEQNIIKFKNIILEEAINTYKPIKKRTYSLTYYLQNFLHMINDAVRWISLKQFKSYNSDSEYHYKVINNEYRKWCNDGVFYRARKKFIQENYYEFYPELAKVKNCLFIDTCFFFNKYGIECIGVYPELRKKKATKLVALVDIYKNLISIIYVENTETIDSINNKEFIKKTFCHDVKCIQLALDNIIIKFNNRKNIYVVGDKSFITPQKFTYNEKNIIIITSKRKRDKKKIEKQIKNIEKKIKELSDKMESINNNTKRYILYDNKKNKLNVKIYELNMIIDTKSIYTAKEKKLLSKRYLVENKFCSLKKYERISLRKDHKINTFMGFIYMVDLLEIVKLKK